MNPILLKLTEIKSKEELHTLLAEKLNLPEHYGKNLDALHDCLTDIHEETEIIIRDLDALKDALGKYANSFERVLNDSSNENENLSVRFLNTTQTNLHHVCLAVKEYDRYVSLFENVFGMTERKSLGEAPNRKIWLHQGIQINELSEDTQVSFTVDHIAIAVDDVKAVVADALDNGCTPLPNGAHWVALPNGVKLELMANS